MIGRILSFLAWAGLYRMPMQILNSANTPLKNTNFTPLEAANITAAFMDTLVEKFVSPDGQRVSYLALKTSPFYGRTFQDFRSLLKLIDPSQMEEQHRKSFFINLYNILTIDAILSMDSLPESTISVTSFWSRYGYQIGPYQLHLDDIEHGVLRGNRPHPSSSKIMFESSDPRVRLSVTPDRRIHSALNCGALSCPSLRAFPAEGLGGALGASMQDFCNKGVSNSNGGLVVNQIFQWFSSDFAPTEQLTIKFLSECNENSTLRRALAEAAEGHRPYTFRYDWTLNAVSGVNGDRVKVEVYLQSLCSDTVRFFTQQLYPAWNDLKDIMDLEFIPFGKARATPTITGGIEFECQHGDDECYGNLVMTCVQNSLPVATQVEFFNCMFSQNYPAFAGRKCSEETGLDWTPLEECAKSNLGAELLYDNGVKTASVKPRIHFIPTIALDGHYDDFQLRASLMSLKNQICSMYQGPPHQNCL